MQKCAPIFFANEMANGSERAQYELPLVQPGVANFQTITALKELNILIMEKTYHQE
jgi:hypothetical protein